MLPVGRLMIEHRLIERMMKLMRLELESIRKENKADMQFLTAAVDFLKIYADKCHHGKEEEILFKVLEEKPLAPEHRKMIDDLLNDHVASRRTVEALGAAKEEYEKGDQITIKDIEHFLQVMLELYAQHIEKEDKHFFLPAMEYLNKQEQEKMLRSFRSFDQSFIHEVYKNVVERWSDKKGGV